MSLPRYPIYKDSGVEWLGEVPEHWYAGRFSRAIEAIKDGTHGTFERVPLGRPLLSAKNVQDGYVLVADDESMVSEADHLSITANGFPRKGDLLLTIVGTIGRSCVYEFEDPIAFQRSVSFIRLLPGNETKFFYYFTQSKFFQEQLASRSKSAAQGGVYMGDVVATSIVFPPLLEQTQIAAFLDRETAKIDKLVAEQRRLMALLKEKRQAVTSHAVTRGLNPDAPLKPSGIEWLGDVPEHWDVSSIKRFADTITDGAHVSPETENGVFPFISTKDVGNDSIDFDSCLRTSATSFEFLVRSGCQPLVGDVLFSKDGTIGRTVVVKEKRDFVVASSLIIIRPDKSSLDPLFLNCLCQSNVVVGQVESFVKGAGLPRLSIQNLLKVIGCFPPLEEQKTLAVFLQREMSKFDTLATEAQRAIDLLQERRTALISAAVTGQIDVRGAVAA